MASEIIITLVGLFCTTVSGIVTFLLTKKKYGAEVESQQIQNMSEAFDAYKKVMQDTIGIQNKKIEMLQEENHNLRIQVDQLQKQLSQILINKLNNM